MKLHFTPRARLDLIGIADYIRTQFRKALKLASDNEK